MMLRYKRFSRFVTWLLILLIAAPQALLAQETNEGGEQVFLQEELDQMLAPIALYPDSLLSQVLMASTYPLEVVQADRWAKENKDLKGDALADVLEEQAWDPSVKSLVQFPDVLAMMGEKLDWTQKLGDAFLSQQEDVMETVQNLRQKAKDAGNLKSSEEQVVKVEKEVIIIEPAKTEVVYVPVYNPTVVYGTWWWPRYPPYYYYPPYYPRPTLYGFATGVAIGVAWGYAWGHWNWHHHSINVNINKNINYNKRIDRDRYAQRYNNGSRDAKWQHKAEHRKGVSYRDNKTAQQYNRAASREAVKSREDFRGKAEAGRKDLARGDAQQFRDRDVQTRPSPGTKDRVQSRDSIQSRDMSKSRDMSRGGAGVQKMDRGSAFSGMNNGSASRDFSNRGSMSRSGSAGRSSGASRGGGMPRGGGGRGGRR